MFERRSRTLLWSLSLIVVLIASPGLAQDSDPESGLGSYDERLEDAVESLGSGDAVRAEGILKSLTSLEPTRKEAHLWLGNALKKQQKWAEAREAYRKFNDLDPENIEGIRELHWMP